MSNGCFVVIVITVGSFLASVTQSTCNWALADGFPIITGQCSTFLGLSLSAHCNSNGTGFITTYNDVYCNSTDSTFEATSYDCSNSGYSCNGIAMTSLYYNESNCSGSLIDTEIMYLMEMDNECLNFQDGNGLGVTINTTGLYVYLENSFCNVTYDYFYMTQGCDTLDGDTVRLEFNSWTSPQQTTTTTLPTTTTVTTTTTSFTTTSLTTTSVATATTTTTAAEGTGTDTTIATNTGPGTSDDNNDSGISDDSGKRIVNAIPNNVLNIFCLLWFGWLLLSF